MRFVCLGYLDAAKWNAMSAASRAAFMEDDFAYIDELRRGGHFLGGAAIQSLQQAATLWRRNGTITITDGPCADHKEALGGILLLEARDLNHVIELLSTHPGIRGGGGAFEIRPADAVSPMQDMERTCSVSTGIA